MNLGIETETLEFKKTTGELKEAMNSICAILNKHQKGELYFGVKSDGAPIGQIVTEESLREVSQKIRNTIEPQIYPEIKLVTIDDRDCIYVGFEGYSVPYFANGVAKLRVSDEDLTMSPQELSDYIRRSQMSQNQWENLISDRTIDDVDEELLKEYTEHAHEIGRIAITYSDKGTVLNKLALTEGNSLLNAGKVLFCDSMEAELQMAIFATSERLTFNDIQRYHGPVTKLVDIAESYIRRNIHWRVVFDGSIKRKEIPEIPMDAVREALLNSFCHKDYNACQSNEVAIYPDRVEIYNPGHFPEGYVPRDFIEKEERPIRRNPRIARILYYSKEIESFGTGLKRIADACEATVTKFEFKMMKSGFVVVFYRQSNEEFIGFDKSMDKTVKSTDKIRINTDKLNLNQQKIIGYIVEQGKITNKEVQELLGVKDSRALKILKELVSLKILEKKGTLKGSYYILIIKNGMVNITE